MFDGGCLFEWCTVYATGVYPPCGNGAKTSLHEVCQFKDMRISLLYIDSVDSDLSLAQSGRCMRTELVPYFFLVVYERNTNRISCTGVLIKTSC